MRILLAIDGSRYSVDVVDAAVLSRPWPAASIIRLLSVVEPEAVLSVESESAESEGKPAGELLEMMASSLEAHGLPVETLVKPGDPREVIVNEAEEWRANLIVMGASGYSGRKNWQLGKVAESVAAHARCSVELVRKDTSV